MFKKILIANRGGRAIGKGECQHLRAAHVVHSPNRLARAAGRDMSRGVANV